MLTLLRMCTVPVEEVTQDFIGPSLNNHRPAGPVEENFNNFGFHFSTFKKVARQRVLWQIALSVQTKTLNCL